ncbi:MAG: A/G-specific adenine glycosylase [Woeseiaceae bacterium]
MASIAQQLLSWHRKFGRKDLPWQHDPTPYRIWISEIMLQQTQVTTVIPYYLRFMESFPDIESLANASTNDVLKHWSGLGYYARARNLHGAARLIRDGHDGQFPETFEAIVELPGIGRSTAGAILSLAFKQRYPILDGNAKRVIARYHAVEGWPGKSAVSKKLWALADQHTPHQDVAAYTQAIMDLGATICTRSGPNCNVCPLKKGCAAFGADAVSRYPGRRETKQKPLRHTHMVLAHIDGAVYLERRPAQGIWGGLWSLPELADGDDVNRWCERELNARPAELDRWQTMRHSFTHYDLDIEPIAVRLSAQSSTLRDTQDSIWYEIGSPPPGGMAAPVNKLIETLRQL